MPSAHVISRVTCCFLFFETLLNVAIPSLVTAKCQRACPATRSQNSAEPRNAQLTSWAVADVIVEAWSLVRSPRPWEIQAGLEPRVISTHQAFEFFRVKAYAAGHGLHKKNARSGWRETGPGAEGDSTSMVFLFSFQFPRRGVKSVYTTEMTGARGVIGRPEANLV